MQVVRSITSVTAAACLFISQAAVAAPASTERSGGGAGVAPQTTPTPVNLIYTPITPCRVFSKKINADTETRFFISGSGDFTSQGGPASGCGVPTYAKAVAITLSTLKPLLTGSLTAYAYLSTRPSVASARFNKGLSETTSATVSLSPGGSINVYPSETASTLGDVVGYYEAQLYAVVDANGTLLDSSGRVNSVVKSSTAGFYDVYFNRNVTGCSLAASTTFLGYTANAGNNGSYVTVATSDSAGTGVNTKFRLTVTC